MLRQLLVLLLVLPSLDGRRASSSLRRGDASCKSPCHTNKEPHCGTWMRGDNAELMAGTYRQSQSRLNLTCTTTSLPLPAHISWYHQSLSNAQWQPVTCDSVDISTKCKSGRHGMHTVVSSCLIELAKLNQSGVYQCSASQPTSGDVVVHSKACQVQVYGVSHAEREHDRRRHRERYDLRRGAVGHIDMPLCANPTPTVVWLNRENSRSVRAGGPTDGRYNALPLQQLFEKSKRTSNGSGEGLQPVEFCYLARLVVANVNDDDAAFTLFVSNSVAAKRLYFHGAVGLATPTAAASPSLVVAAAVALLGLVKGGR